MTNWEKSCVEALVASPTAFALFKAKQKNKKHVDQYLNKIWPYKIVKKSEKERKPSFNDFGKILNVIESFKEKYDDCVIVQFGNTVLSKEKLINQIEEAFNKDFKINTFHTSIEIEIRFYEEEGDVETECFDIVNHERDLCERLKHRIGCLYRLNISQVKISLKGENRYSAEVRNGFIDQFLKSFNFYKKHEFKYKKEYLGQNVGIEIEYDGPWQKYLHRHLNSSRYAVSFNSGIDGGNECMNKDNWQDDSRLRENRLRINGARGLNSLYFLLESMKKDGCKIDTASGMHYHIDLRNRNIRSERRLEQAKPVNILNSIMQDRILYDTFELKESFASVKELENQINLRYPTEFNTIEWRFGSPCLNFTKLTIQILFSLHVTNAMFAEDRMVDIEYLTFLSTLIAKTNF